MRVAFVDTSCFVAVLLGEPSSDRIARRLRAYAAVYASTLLESELRSAALRERIVIPEPMLDVLHWVHPERRLAVELERVFAAGHLRGADAWHLACALFVFEDPGDAPFLTLDERQGAVARRLGFRS